MTGPGVFDVALTGDDERRMAKTAAQDKLAAAIYDVRDQFGDWLFGATDRQGFHDRVAMCRTAICHTIEPHTHAGIGVQTRVIKALEREWRQRSACYPGCDKNEAHAAKFHKDKADEKEASRRQALGIQPGDTSSGGPPLLTSQLPGGGTTTVPGSMVPDRVQAPTADAVVSGQLTAARRWLAEFEDQPDHPELHTKETYQDHEGEELIPEGNFEGYKDRVDQGTPEKVDSHAFIPGSHDQQHNESGDDNFVKKVTGAHMQRRQQIIADASQNYLSMLAMLRTADDTTGNDPNAGVAGVGTAPGAAAPPAPNMTTTTSPAGAPGAATPAASPVAPAQGMPMTASADLREMLAAVAPADFKKRNPAGGDGSDGRHAEQNEDDWGHEYPATRVDGHDTNGFGMPTNEWGEPTGAPAMETSYQGRHRAAMWARKAIVQSGSLGARVRLLEASRGRGIDHIVDAFVPVYSNRQKCADRNYLQQADEALTKVLNEKAEEFQNTIAPLQQALITIQQAEQLSNPLNVQPPAGTVNVLPQGAQGAAAAAPSGQVPQLGADPAAAMLAGQQPAGAAGGGQQMAASRGRRPFDRRGGNVMRQPAPKVPRHADVNAEYQSWLKKKPGLPTGGEVDIDNFAEEKHVGPRAKQTLQKSQGLAPVMANYEPDYIWSKSPESTKGEFASRLASGETPDGVFRKMIAEIADHHSKGIIGSHDAHRAANEAFGRLLMARRKAGKQSRPFV